ncbi:MAG TPA: ABC transporter substrate-binding protein [Candidatus Eisenbacteria bacterium]|jgi:multiple sugar transport system substrate-binding protein
MVEKSRRRRTDHASFQEGTRRFRVATRRKPLAAAIAFALIAITCALLASAPASTTRDAATSLTVLLPGSERPFWQPIASRFEREHPGVKVDLVEGPQSTDLRENIYTASLLAKDPTFDLVYMDVTWTAKFAAAGWLVPLDEFVSPAERLEFLPSAIAAGEYEGVLYRMPVRTDVGLLYYRRDLLAAAGLAPPHTFDELLSAARRLQSPPGLWGFVWQGKQYEGLVCNFLEVLSGCGGYWVDPAFLDVGLDRPEALAALSFMLACVRDHPVSPPGVATYEEEESRRLFQDGRAVFLRSWPYAWQLAQMPGSPVRGRVGVLPMVHAVEGRSAGTLGGWGLGVSTYSRHRSLAMEFIRAITSPAGQRALCAPTGYAPALKAAYADPELLGANAFLAELERLHENAVLRPPIPRYALASDILQRHLSAVLAGSERPASALRAAAAETRAMLAGARATASTR